MQQYIQAVLNYNVPLVEFVYLVFTRMTGYSYRRRLGSLLRLCDVLRALITSLVCWLSLWWEPTCCIFILVVVYFLLFTSCWCKAATFISIIFPRICKTWGWHSDHVYVCKLSHVHVATSKSVEGFFGAVFTYVHFWWERKCVSVMWYKPGQYLDHIRAKIACNNNQCVLNNLVPVFCVN